MLLSEECRVYTKEFTVKIVVNGTHSQSWSVSSVFPESEQCGKLLECLATCDLYAQIPMHLSKSTPHRNV